MVDTLHSWQHVRIYRRLEVAEYLLDNGAEVDLQDSEGRCALMRAVASKDTKNKYPIMRLLLQYGAQVSLQNAQGQTVIDVARENGVPMTWRRFVYTTYPGHATTRAVTDTATEGPLSPEVLLTWPTGWKLLQTIQQTLSSLRAQVQQGFQYMKKAFQEHDQTITQQDEAISQLKTKLDDLDAMTIHIKNDPLQSERPESCGPSPHLAGSG